jgi:hypothetical protein
MSGGRLTLTAAEPLEIDGTTSFRPRVARGCTPYPEADVNVSGNPHAGVTPFQEVRGYVDAHTHHMAFEFLGGEVHCGKPWDRFGAPYALVDCEDHTLTGGYGAVLETALSGTPGHDPVGWPTFVDWAASGSSSTCWSRTISCASSTRSSGTPATTWTPSACRPRRPTPSRTTSTRSSAARARASTGS